MSHSEPGDRRQRIWIAIGLLLAGALIALAAVIKIYPLILTFFWLATIVAWARTSCASSVCTAD